LRLGVPQPCTYVRFHKGSPAELHRRVADNIRAGRVGPTIYNDEVIVPAYVHMGIPVEHARDYSSDGCWEPHIQGRTYFKHGWVSLAEALDRVLAPAHWEKVSVPVYIEAMDPFKDSKPVDAYRFETFDEVMDAVKRTLDRYIGGFIASRESFEDGRLYDIAPLPLLSAFSRGPLESGRDITRGGIEYTIHMPELLGLSHVVDSLAVIKKLCFEERSLPWSDLLDAVRHNWEGREALRQRVMTRVPSYGNDVDYVDEIAVDIVSFYIDSVKRHSARARSNIKYVAGIATFESYPELGYLVGATPDGRLAREPLSSNASPSIGRAASGQTAAVGGRQHPGSERGIQIGLAVAPRSLRQVLPRKRRKHSQHCSKRLREAASGTERAGKIPGSKGTGGRIRGLLCRPATGSPGASNPQVRAVCLATQTQED